MVQDHEQSFRQWAKEHDPSKHQRRGVGPNVGNAERWVCAFGGGALAALGISRRSVGGGLLAAAGAYLLYRGVSGQDPIYRRLGVDTLGEKAPKDVGVSQHRGVRVEHEVRLEASPDEVYHVWRRLENLPRFMTHLKSVKTLPNGTSHWTAKGPVGIDVSWDAEIVGDQPGKAISWRSLPHSSFHNAGAVRFDDEGGATRLHVSLTYNPPAGKLGAAVARLLGEDPDAQIKNDLEEFKTQMAAGAFAAGSESAPHDAKRVDRAVNESFPASDPPSYSRGTATEKQ